MKPTESEPICVISFEVTVIRLGGGPEERPSFWKVYRQELELNRRTRYDNEHTRICRPLLVGLKSKVGIPAYFRKDRLVFEKVIKDGKTASEGAPRERQRGADQ